MKGSFFVNVIKLWKWCTSSILINNAFYTLNNFAIPSSCISSKDYVCVFIGLLSLYSNCYAIEIIKTYFVTYFFEDNINRVLSTVTSYKFLQLQGAQILIAAQCRNTGQRLAFEQLQRCTTAGRHMRHQRFRIPFGTARGRITATDDRHTARLSRGNNAVHQRMRASRKVGEFKNARRSVPDDQLGTGQRYGK